MNCSKIERSIIKEQIRWALAPIDGMPVKGQPWGYDGELRGWFISVLECIAILMHLDDERARTVLRLRYQERWSHRRIERVHNIPRRTQGRLEERALDAVVDAMDARVGRDIINIHDRRVSVSKGGK